MRLLALLALAACYHDIDDDFCEAPAQTELTCEPIIDGSAGCVNGPPGGLSPELEGRTFPEGCVATLPICDDGSPPSPLVFTCVRGMGLFEWRQ